jgi:hypothetical protein
METKIVQYVKELYPEGCLITLLVQKDKVLLLKTENIILGEAQE